jgi:hypothetical protein
MARGTKAKKSQSSNKRTRTKKRKAQDDSESSSSEEVRKPVAKKKSKKDIPVESVHEDSSQDSDEPEIVDADTQGDDLTDHEVSVSRCNFICQ